MEGPMKGKFVHQVGVKQIQQHLKIKKSSMAIDPKKFVGQKMLSPSRIIG